MFKPLLWICYLIRSFLLLLFLTLGVNSDWAILPDWQQIQFPAYEHEITVGAPYIANAARAPSHNRHNITSTGALFSGNGDVRALDGKETHWASLNFSRFLNATKSVVKPISVSPDVKTWNQFQAATKGKFVTRADAAKGWDLYKQAHGIQTGAKRSQAAKSFFLTQLQASGKTPKWMNQWLSKGKVPPGYQVDHIKPLSIGGADSPVNMRLLDIQTHKTHHKIYAP